MSHCVAQQEQRPCSHRRKCRISPQNQVYNNANEMPANDTSYRTSGNDETPPEPPNGDYSSWELQYCKWWGWTWVKKGDKGSQRSRPGQAELSWDDEKPSVSKKSSDSGRQRNKAGDKDKKKKGGGFFNCFKSKKKDAATDAKPSSSKSTHKTNSVPSNVSDKRSEKALRGGPHYDDDDCLCCYCQMESDCYCEPYPCNQLCCTCMNNMMQPQTPKISMIPCKACKTCETQTVQEVKEQETKMSETYVNRRLPPQQSPKRRCCRCTRPIAYPCMRKTCCPCMQPQCCPCKNVSIANQCCPCPQKNEYTGTDNIVNFCLQRNIPLKAEDFLKAKSPQFSTLHKSLDLLLKNNINIMNLFDDKKELKSEEAPLSGFSSNHTIACLSNDSTVKRSDLEHRKLLTAVCDAILSSHKFDNNKFKSENKAKCEAVDSRTICNAITGKGLLEKIFSNFNLATTTKNNEKNNVFTPPKEIGVQVENKKASPPETLPQPKKSLTTLMRKKSKTWKPPRVSRKTETLKRNIELLKMAGRKKSFLDTKRSYRRKMEEDKKAKAVENKLNLNEAFIHEKRRAINKPYNTSPLKSPRGSSNNYSSFKMKNIEALLNTLDYSSSANSDFRQYNGTSNSSAATDSFNILENTSRTILDSMVLYTTAFDESKEFFSDNK